MPFRETHHISGRAVALAEKTNVQISDLSLEQYKELSEHFTEDVMQVFDFETSVEKRNAIGGPARAMIQRQVEGARKRIEGKAYTWNGMGRNWALEARSDAVKPMKTWSMDLLVEVLVMSPRNLHPLRLYAP